MVNRKAFFAGILAALLVAAFMATSVLSYFVAHDSLSTQIAEETLPLTSDNIYSEIDQDLLRSVLISSLMAHDTFVRDWVLDGEKSPGAIQRYLEEIRDKHDTTTAFFVSERTRRYYHPDGILGRVDPDDPGDAWYFRVREMSEPYEINIDADTADRSRLSIFVNYRVTDFNGNFVGATGVGLAVESVADMIAAYQKRYGRQIYFIDREGEVTLRGAGFDGATRIQERAGMGRIATSVLTSPSGAFDYRTADGRTVYVNSRLIPEFDWYLIVEQPESAAEARILNALFVNMGMALGITVLVLVLGWLTIRGYQRRLEEMAMTDKLTGVGNRESFELAFERTVSVARRGASPVSLLSLDVDNLKPVNDSHGHGAGDAMLRLVASVIREQTRRTDTLCRWGGDEFLVLLPGCTVDAARDLAESVRRRISERLLHFGDADISVTVSLGVAQYHGGETLDAFVARCDGALYDAKRQGRDRVALG